MNKRILFIAPKFHSYTLLIITCLKNLGYDVTFIENKMFRSDIRCSTWPIYSILYKLKHRKEKSKYTNLILEQINNKQFDVLFVINGFSITKKLMEGIERRNPGIKKILYLWDSLCYWKYSNILKLFDSIWSFDIKDCCKYSKFKIKYSSNFYIGDKINKSDSSSRNVFDIVHIGSINIYSYHRIKILMTLKRYCVENNISNYIKLVFNPYKNGKLNWRHIILTSMTSLKYLKLYYYFFLYRKSDIFSTNTIEYKKVNEIESNAKVIVDIPLKKQNGCTIRSLEAIARGQKLITTGDFIKNLDFYKSSNIFILNETNYLYIKDFIKIPSRHIEINKYNLENWCKNLINN